MLKYYVNYEPDLPELRTIIVSERPMIGMKPTTRAALLKLVGEEALRTEAIGKVKYVFGPESTPEDCGGMEPVVLTIMVFIRRKNKIKINRFYRQPQQKDL